MESTLRAPSRQSPFTLARAIRAVLFQNEFSLPIVLGPLRGFRLTTCPSLSIRELVGLTERQVFSHLSKLKQFFGAGEGSSFLDIGANFGLYSFWLSRTFPLGQIHAFEPVQATFNLLTKNLNRNRLTQIRTHQLALSDKSGAGQIAITDNLHTSSLEFTGPSTEDNPEFAQRTETIALARLDDLILNSELQMAPPAFLKIDVEGAAHKLLSGATQTLTKHRPVIYIESHSTTEDAAIGKLLLELNYEAFRIEDEQFVLNKNTTHPDPDGVWGRLILIPRSQADFFRGLVLQ